MININLEKIKEQIEKHKIELANKYHIKQIGVFGSYVRNEQTEKSDIDILVDFSVPISLFEFIDLEEELSNLLNIKVDLVYRKALKPHIGKHIIEEVQLV